MLTKNIIKVFETLWKEKNFFWKYKIIRIIKIVVNIEISLKKRELILDILQESKNNILTLSIKFLISLCKNKVR